MTIHQPPDSHSKSKPDEIQKQFWHYRRVWIGIIIALVAGRFLLPHLPMLKGWEQKFSVAAIDIGIEAVPEQTTQVTSVEQALTLLQSKIPVPAKIAQLNKAFLLSAWKCAPLKNEGLCLRYVLDDEPLTLVISLNPKRTNKFHGPFTKAGWAGYYVVKNGVAAALVGPFDPNQLLEIWPYAQELIAPPK
ncbi:MAG: hypothetical protein SGI74_01650 [Oligoflexia bacterium]|nr:hypothetical protein [Oligoflexia bacterium]